MITIHQLKQLVDPVAIISETVGLRRFGKRHSGLCPFHSENTPSFSFWESSQRWKCFGCGKGGDIVTFLELRDGLDFVGAKRRLAEIAGVPFDDRDTVSASPSVPWKLAGPEMRAFEEWLDIERRRLAAFWDFLDQQEAACMAYLDGCWNVSNEELDPKAVAGVHRTLNFIHGARQEVDARLMQLDDDPSAEVEPFLRRLYGSEDFREAVAA